jgi:acetyl coenzyme A synthetase (ADP forming)-like protein
LFLLISILEGNFLQIYKQKIDEEKIINQMKYLIEPRSIAVIGASDNTTKVGGIITRNLITSDFNGKIFLVNPHDKEIFGRKSFSTVLDIKDDIDLAEIVVPAKIVPEILEEVGKKNIKSAIIISAGFSEIGNYDLENKIAEIIKKYGIRVVGPNCFGIVNTEIGLDLTFTFTHAEKGNISFISQSGAMCCGALDWAANNELGFSKFINLGNKIDVDEGDVLLYLKNDPQTKVICMYVEGFKNGRKFFEAAKRVSKVKPIIAIKSGTTEAGSRASLSHTGSISGSEEIINAAFKQAGIVRVNDIESLFDAAIAFSTQPLPNAGNAAIVTNAGGIGVMTTDWLTKLGLNVPLLDKEIRDKIESKILNIGSSANPIDMTGAADHDTYFNVIKILDDTPNIDIIIAAYVSQGLITSDIPARAVVEATKNSKKTILGLWVGGASIIEGVNILRRNKIPCFQSTERLSETANMLYQYKKFKNEHGNIR